VSYRVIGTNISGSEISSEIEIEMPSGLTEAQRNRIKDEAGELIIDHILGRVGKAESPIRGADWPALSKEYKKFKKAQGRGSKANMEFHGDMLDALEYVRTDSGVKIQIKGGEAAKADGHNQFGGESGLPKRQFLPEEGDKFKGSLTSDIKSIVAEEAVSRFKVDRIELGRITTKAQLNTFLRGKFPQTPVADVKNAILLNDDLRRIFAFVLGLF